MHTDDENHFEYALDLGLISFARDPAASSMRRPQAATAFEVDHGFDKSSAADLQKRLQPLIRKTQPYRKRIAHKGGTVWYEWGGLRKFLLGVGHFLWYWLSYGIFYGIAGAIGTSMRSTF
jgi:hypothetical protein